MEPDSVLTVAVRVLAAGALAALASLRLRVPAVAGLLVVGALVGPSGLGWIDEAAGVAALAELGVVLLLFTIGLEFSRERMAELGRALVVGGSVQVAVAVALACAAARVAGLGWGASVLVGFAVALSSTALGLKLYGDRGELAAPHGRLALAILIFQDLALVGMVALVPALAGELSDADPGRWIELGAGVIGLAAATLGGRWAAPRLLELAARRRSRETFLLAAVAVCVGMAWLSERLGLSPALGAFLAGFLLADSDISQQAAAEIGPVRELFAGIFFLSMGMLVDLEFVAQRPLAVAAAALAVVAIKAAATGAAGRLLGLPTRPVVLAALGLAQIGEFSFVLLELGRVRGLLAGETHQLLVAAAAVTLLATPALVAVAPRAAELVARVLPGPPPVAGSAEEPKVVRPVLIIGFGINGRILARILRESGVGYTVIDADPELVRAARAEGEPIVFGDASQPEILRHAGIETARVVVVAVSDPGITPAMVRCIRKLAPGTEIVARTARIREIESIERSGADRVVAEEYETAIEVYTWVLQKLHLPRNVIAAHTRLLRGEDYRALRGGEAPSEVARAVSRALAIGTTEVYRLLDDSAAVGRSLAELDLRRHCGALVIAVVRDDTPHLAPGAEFRLASGDDLVLVGAHAEIERAFDLLAGPRESASGSEGLMPGSKPDRSGGQES